MKTRKIKFNFNLIFGIALAVLVFLPVLIGVFKTPYDVDAMDYAMVNKPPAFAHPFGTDNFGRDIFSRIMSGGAVTFAVSLLTVAVGAVLGTVVGALTGYFGGVADEIIMRVNDGLASFPSILLALVIVSVLDKGTMNIVIALGIVFIPSFARIMRGEFLVQREKDYVKNARLMGVGHMRIIFVHILPNTKEILFSTMLIAFNNAILAEAGLSFLGLGVQPPSPSLGRMLAESQTYLLSAPWYAVFTGVYIVASILAITLIGENYNKDGHNYKKIKSKFNRTLISTRPVKESEGEQTDIDVHGDTTLLSISSLSMGFLENGGITPCLRDVNISISDGEIVGIVGESGAGKSMTARAVMGILPEKAFITGGAIWFREQKTAGHQEDGMIRLDALDERAYSHIRGNDIAMIFQEPMTSLNPLMTVRAQVEEVLDLHSGELSEEEKQRRVTEAFEDAELPDEAVEGKYPHQLSGGQRQRVIIAMALAARPRLIIADEPTTALDADVQDRILALLGKINRKHGMAIMLISHDLRVIRRLCGRAVILQNGTVVEHGNLTQIFEAPRQDYTRRLILASRGIARDDTEHKGDDVLLSVRNLNVYYKDKHRGFFSKSEVQQVCRDMSFDVMRGDTFGIVGGSGSGKSSLVKAIAGFVRHYDGVIELACKRPSMVFQDPYGSLNPVKRVGWLLEEPLRMAGVKREERARRVEHGLSDVDLPQDFADRYVSELSGGQRQRVAIALAIILRQDLIILDEPVSALDVTIQEQILELLIRLKKKYNLAYIFISHDMDLVKRMCNRVCEIQNGAIIGITCRNGE